jgi:hypothetical protein
MRLAVLALLLVLAGCASWSKPPVPKQPEGPTDGGIVATVGTQLDKVDGRVAAAVTVANRNSDKPEVVKAETGVALSYLPPASEADIAYAEKRASKVATPDGAKTYKDAEAYGKKLQAEVEAGWKKMEETQREAKRVSDLKDRRIEELAAEIERVKKDHAEQTWTWVGAGLAVIGALTTAFLGPKIGIPLLLGGAFCGAVPFIYDSPAFLWVAIGTAAIAAGLGLWWLADRVKDSVNTPPTP